MKKIIIIIFLTLFISTVHVFSAEGPTRLGFGVGKPNAVFVFRPGQFDFKGGYDFSDDDGYVFFSGDYRLVRERNLIDWLYFSIGIGGYTRFNLSSEDENEEKDQEAFEGGARLPIAFQVFFFDDFLEFFIEVAPALSFMPKLQFADDPVQAWIGFTIALD